MVNWTYKGHSMTSAEDFPAGVLGFIYKITDHTNNMIYIGRKSIFSTKKRRFGKKDIAAMTNKRLKKWEYVTKPMKGWQSYTGSCAPLNEKIEEGIMYTKEIIHLCRTKQELSYFELKYQMIEGVIEPGNNSYNSNVSGRYYPKMFIYDKKQI